VIKYVHKSEDELFLPGIGIDVGELATQNQVKLNDARKNPIFPKKKNPAGSRL
jgi:hypothetical protein